MAAGAIHELVGIDTKQMHNEHVEFGYASGIGGMQAAKDCANNMLQAISAFSQAVLDQANKFPALAEKIETRDIADATRWEA
jgi:hypothetical protein